MENDSHTGDGRRRVGWFLFLCLVLFSPCFPMDGNVKAVWWCELGDSGFVHRGVGALLKRRAVGVEQAGLYCVILHGPARMCEILARDCRSPARGHSSGAILCVGGKVIFLPNHQGPGAVAFCGCFTASRVMRVSLMQVSVITTALFVPRGQTAHPLGPIKTYPNG